MTTSRKLWLGFGTLIALLVLSLLLIIVRLSSINDRVALAADARQRLDMTSSLELHVARYALGIDKYVYGGAEDSEYAIEQAARVERSLARYEEFARTDAQRGLAERFAAQWGQLRGAGEALLASRDANAASGSMAAFHAARLSLAEMIENELRADAVAAFDTRRSNAREDLVGVFRFALFALAGGALLAIITSWSISRTILRSGRTLAEQAERLRTTLASIGDGVIATDAAGRIVSLNPMAESLTGWNNRDARGQPLPTVFHIVNESTREEVDNPALRALREGTVVGLANQTVLIAKDGAERAIDDSAAPIRCTDGEIVGSVLVFRDVSEKRKAAAALRRSERELSEFFENASLAIRWVAPDGTILRANQRELQMLGYEHDEYVGHNVKEFFLDEALVEDNLEKLSRGETVRDQAMQMRCKDGSVVDVLIDSNALFESGELVHSRSFTRNVTELKKAQSASAALAAIVESSEDAIVSKSLQGIVQSWNQAAERVFGYSAQEAVGRHISFLFPPDRIAEEDQILASIRAGQRVEHFESVRVSKDGRTIPISLTISPIRDQSGRIVGASKIARDITAQKEAEAALRESEVRFRTMADQAPVLIWLSGPDKKRTWFNKQWLDFVGRTMEQELGDGWIENVHPDDLDRCIATYNDACDRHEHVEMEYRLRRYDGEYRWVLDRGVPRFKADDGFHGYIGSCADIHDRIESSAALRRKSAALETIHRVNLTVAADLNLDSLLQSVTDLATTLTRAQFGAFLYNAIDEGGGHYMLYTVSGAQREAFEKFDMPGNTALFAATFEGKGVIRSDDVTKEESYGLTGSDHGAPNERLPIRSYLAAPVVSRSGEVHGGLFFGHPEIGVFDEQDEHVVSGIAAQAAVAIDNARLYEQLRTSEERYRVLSETIPAIVWAVQPDGQLFYLNPAWAEYTGQPAEEAYGGGWIEVIHPDDRKRVKKQWDRSLLSGEVIEGELRLRRHDGTHRWHFYRGAPVRGEDGAIAAWHGTSVDIQEQKSAEQALREADRRKDEFLATLSHELRNPLAPISMGLEVLKGFRGDPVKVEETRAMMQRQTRQLIRLVDDLLDVSRITEGKLELRRTTVKLSDVIASALEASQVFVREGGHQLDVSLPDEPLLIDADPARLAQVVSNLVINAAKYTPRGGRVSVVATREGNDVLLTVTDTGIGIPSDMLDRVFDLFAQVKNGSHASASGLGIGLTLVKSLVQMHGGTVEARSEGPNRGSEFRVRLPIVAQAQDASSTRNRSDSPENRVSRRVLVVDDNTTAADMLGTVVEMLGNEVRTAYDGSQALEMSAAYHPEVVFMDLAMPKIDGYEVAREIRKQEWGRSALLVALTGWGQQEHRSRTKDAGFDLHLVKPGKLEDLEKIFSELDGRGRQPPT